jgi:hypothetical protein
MMLAGLRFATAACRFATATIAWTDVVNLLASGDREPRLVSAVQQKGENRTNHRNSPPHSIILFYRHFCALLCVKIQIDSRSGVKIRQIHSSFKSNA